MIQNTLIVSPQYAWTKEKGAPNYGRVFEREFSHHGPGFEDSITHHRAILYHLGPLRVVVLCEVDAAVSGSTRSMELNHWTVGPKDEHEAQKVEAAKKKMRPHATAERKMFGTITKQPFDLQTPEYWPCSNVVRRGGGTLSSLTVEMVTGQRKTKLAQMWLGRTPVNQSPEP